MKRGKNMTKMEELKARIEESRKVNKRLTITSHLKKLIREVFKDSDMSKKTFCEETALHLNTLHNIVGRSTRKKRTYTKRNGTLLAKQKTDSKDFLIHEGNLYVKFPKNLTKGIALEYMKGLG